MARWSTAAALVVLCVVAYANSFHSGFVLDNKQLILNDPRVHAVTRANLSLIARHSYWWPLGESGLYRPLTTISYLLNYAVLGNGTAPAGYHWLNLLLHVTNVLLLWRIVGTVTSHAWTAAVAAAIWAVLPLSTEAVTNIVGRADLLAATGSMTAILMYLQLRDAPTSAPHLPTASLLRWSGIAVALLVGVLSKESALAVVGVLVLIEALWWRKDASIRRLVTLAIVCGVPLAVWALLRASVVHGTTAAEFPFTDNPIVDAPFWQGRLTAVEVMWRYVALVVWPAHLSADYSYTQIPLAQGTVVDWLACALLLGGTAAALWQARHNRPVLLFAGLAFVMFLPASNLLFATGTMMGERLLYLPSAGLAALVAVALAAASTTRARHIAATIAVVLIVVACSGRTIARNRDWADDVTLWRATVKAAPSSAKAHTALAEALYDAAPSHANLDQVMAESDRGVALLEAVPDEQNSFRSFRQAGAYYLDQANRTADGPGGTGPEPRRLYSRAVNLLDRAVLIARANAIRYPQGSLEPEADAQRLRAAAILGLDNPSLALAAANRARALSPLHPLGYRLAAASLLAMHRDEEAAMLLLAGSVVAGDTALGQQAMTLYAGGLDPDGCAVQGSGAGASLNPQCPIVHRHSCVASAAAYQILLRSGQQQRAQDTKATAIASLACPADLMDRSNPLVP